MSNPVITEVHSLHFIYTVCFLVNLCRNDEIQIISVYGKSKSQRGHKTLYGWLPLCVCMI